MLDKKTFWMNALNWGCVGGVLWFLVTLLGWKLGTRGGWVSFSLLPLLCASLIYVSGRRNAALAGAEAGYPYGRAIGFVMAMMLVAGALYGVGMYFFYNFIAPDAYETAMAPMMAQLGEMADSVVGMMKSLPMQLFQGVFGLEFWGLLFGLVVCAFVTRKPDFFASNNG